MTSSLRLASLAAILAGALISAPSCSLDIEGTAEGLDPANLDATAEATAEATTSIDDDGAPPDSCVPETGSTCSSPGLCFTGTVLCDGSCNAPPDPPKLSTPCTTAKGCAGKYDCDGNCVGEPSSTGKACTTTNGCPGKTSCDETCVGDPPNFGKACATPKGCTSKYDCAGSCPESTLVDKACKTVNGCNRKTDCAGKCNEDPAYGTTCVTAKGCTKTRGCDLSCPADDPKVGTTCSTGGCSNGTFDCALVCKLPPGAGAACVSATCGIATKRDCLGACPDPKPGDTTAVCDSCTCPGGKVDVYFDACGRCPTCSSSVCTGSDAGWDGSVSLPDIGLGG
ncbi:MAG: hypothetical protein HYV09_01615 [Deltaproteobacteria bacterium]|nr:hypothetical protein [Deltaproteobacteria bacterium]